MLTNSVCGHPGPDESLLEAVVRRAQAELGLQLTAEALRLVLPAFSYRAAVSYTHLDVYKRQGPW